MVRAQRRQPLPGHPGGQFDADAFLRRFSAVHHDPLGGAVAQIVALVEPSHVRLLDARLRCRQPPDLEEVRQALGRTVTDGIWTSDVIGRIHALIKKASPRKEPLDINETILEVIALTRGKAVKTAFWYRRNLRKACRSSTAIGSSCSK